MRLYILEPEVAGGHGENTVYQDRKIIDGVPFSDNIKYLHYEMDGWLGDDLLESTPAFIVSKRLSESLIDSGFNGVDCRLDECLVTKSDVFDDIYSNLEIPKFYRFLPLGSIVVTNGTYDSWSGHHFNVTPMGDLVVTDQALSLLKQFSINHCDITPI